MTTNRKLQRIKVLLGVEGESEDTLLTEYLDMASDEILNWLYDRYDEVPEGTELPAKYDQVQIFAVMAGYGIAGAEGQTSHSENGISRVFKYPDMLAYIHANVHPYVRFPE